MIEASKLFSTKNLKQWLPYYKKQGERIIDALADNKVNYNEFYIFFQKHGDMLLQFVEKMTIDELKGDSYKTMSDAQRAFIGHSALWSFMKELSTEVYAEEQLLKEKKKDKK